MKTFIFLLFSTLCISVTEGQKMYRVIDPQHPGKGIAILKLTYTFSNEKILKYRELAQNVFFMDAQPGDTIYTWLAESKYQIAVIPANDSLIRPEKPVFEILPAQTLYPELSALDVIKRMRVFIRNGKYKDSLLSYHYRKENISHTQSCTAEENLVYLNSKNFKCNSIVNRSQNNCLYPCMPHFSHSTNITSLLNQNILYSKNSFFTDKNLRFTFSPPSENDSTYLVEFNSKYISGKIEARKDDFSPVKIIFRKATMEFQPWQIFPSMEISYQKYSGEIICTELNEILYFTNSARDCAFAVSQNLRIAK